MEKIIIGGLLSYIITLLAIPAIIQIAKMKKLYDLPDDRKVHATPVPSLGGVGIFAGFLIAFLLLSDLAPRGHSFPFYIAAFVVVFFFGVKDDILVITPLKKFLGQLAVAIILMYKSQLLIDNMHGFLNIGIIPPVFSYPLTMFTIIVVMNSFNLIDGVDGLAASIGFITCTLFSLFFYLNNDWLFALMGISMSGALLAFLRFNFAPARIFMGDTGAMLLGLVNAILVIHFIKTAEGSNILPVYAAPAMGFGILLLPLLDTLRVFGIRIFNKRSPFSADRNHLHHMLLDRGYSHKKITLCLSVVSILFIVLSYAALPLGTTKVILAQIILFFSAIFFLYFANIRQQKKNAIAIGAEDPENFIILTANKANTIAAVSEK
ncbi:MraY family glycosyltransferase [Hydrotalea sp.]|uniref:glycosyltransferase family 4 protein n=1 Tax=Hydrotalea sp. TaxID=2881279 RepID=UPI00262DB541|nr:MraY family glycosyltransferase [Hydrotalea sp.]